MCQCRIQICSVTNSLLMNVLRLWMEWRVLRSSRVGLYRLGKNFWLWEQVFAVGVFHVDWKLKIILELYQYIITLSDFQYNCPLMKLWLRNSTVTLLVALLERGPGLVLRTCIIYFLFYEPNSVIISSICMNTILNTLVHPDLFPSFFVGRKVLIEKPGCIPPIFLQRQHGRV